MYGSVGTRGRAARLDSAVSAALRDHSAGGRATGVAEDRASPSAQKETLGFEWVADGVWSVFFGDVLLGR
jgi:hypothetical protein